MVSPWARSASYSLSNRDAIKLSVCTYRHALLVRIVLSLLCRTPEIEARRRLPSRDIIADSIEMVVTVRAV